MKPLRLMIYDRTCTGTLVGLTHAWKAGGYLWGGLGRLDAWKGVADWTEALQWLGTFQGDRRIGQIEYWGHGRWGRVLIGQEPLDAEALVRRKGELLRIRERLASDALVWFRTCDTFGADRGHDFARRFTDLMGCSAAGHTFVIALLQSGLHRLAPGQAPHWPATEGIREGTPSEPRRSSWSGLGKPNTITCLQDRVPAGW
jgi:hypothetical protein